MQWTDRTRQIKIILIAAAIIIALLSLIIFNALTRNLAQQERSRMQIWAEAMKSLSEADENTDLALVLKLINENNTIPVIVLDEHKNVTDYRNVTLKATTAKDSLEQITQLATQFRTAGHSIPIQLGSGQGDYIEICYDDSLLLKQIAVYPYAQLAVVILFVAIAIFALQTSKRAEQNKVWVGLSKETAHQLGTPISSLLAWTTILQESYPEDNLLPEMEKDIERLQLIADRFSKIGSLPEPLPTSLNEILTQTVDYMDRRTSKKIIIREVYPSNDIIVRLNQSLFQWVVENLCRNAADAIGDQDGTISISLIETQRRAIVEISDTGKGIARKNLKNVFRPGFTTKERGWGLGLSLAKRIVEDYHHGRIYVKNSEPGRGTTFAIELKK